MDFYCPFLPCRKIPVLRPLFAVAYLVGHKTGLGPLPTTRLSPAVYFPQQRSQVVFTNHSFLPDIYQHEFELPRYLQLIFLFTLV